MTNPNVERAISLGAKIEAARKHLESLEAEMAELVGDGASRRQVPLSASTGKLTAAADAHDVARSVPERIIEVMLSTPGKSFSSDDFKSQMPETSIQYIRSSLVRLANAERIRRVSHGQYRLVPAQASLPNVAAAQK
jgi:hypothetical protein